MDNIINLVKNTKDIKDIEKLINLTIQKSGLIFYPTIFEYRKNIVDEIMPRTSNPDKIFELLKNMNDFAHNELKEKDSIINQIFRSHSLSPFEFKAKPNIVSESLVKDLEKLKRHLQRVSNYLQSV